MNPHLKHIIELLDKTESLSDEQKEEIVGSLKSADKELTILEFKLDRTEKVKRTTAILLEETIEELEQKRRAIEEAMSELKATQDQLVQQEKLASLGQLTAGIAHEIKNPLNFVNNFSDVSIELIEEAREELVEEVKRQTSDVRRETGKSPFEGGSEQGEEEESTGDQNLSTILEILDDVKLNLKKIHEHGTRADSIVKSMLQHSRGGDGKPEPTDLNALLKEYVNLAFHGMRAGSEPINVDIVLNLDESIDEVPLIAEDFSRVILNLCNNAFDAMREKEKQSAGSAQPSDTYTPKLTIQTQKSGSSVTIEIEDNGPGIPLEIKDKILQPFFTTKKGKEGTGLGLSITNDIINAHGGSLQILSERDQFTKFIITLILK
ncbi:sensor histidine kinase [Rhodohalobacter mucosus]|uniref:histidine kinase n=1 Tax=Rhodohalobacter mucosus TaxID=2079485 RepID=A0A316TQ35_9BACT|nr:ATP-binding protein [Rhodohalobacter mucosus]PWN05781.1 two-component sensor histidine kinase [Rhodohalobacter mucosus]